MSNPQVIEVFHYPKCSTCRNALKWLDAQGIAHTPVNIVEHPPSVAKLAQALARSGGELRKLFNTSGQSYRGGGWKDKLAAISEADALAALAADGMLIKRPLVLGDELVLIGFKPDEWAKALLPSGSAD